MDMEYLDLQPLTPAWHASNSHVRHGAHCNTGSVRVSGHAVVHSATSAPPPPPFRDLEDGRTGSIMSICQGHAVHPLGQLVGCLSTFLAVRLLESGHHFSAMGNARKLLSKPVAWPGRSTARPAYMLIMLRPSPMLLLRGRDRGCNRPQHAEQQAQNQHGSVRQPQ